MREFDYQQVKNPLYFRDNRIDAHSDHAYYRTAEEAEREVSSFRYLMNGTWKFAYAKNPSLAIPGFEKMDYDCTDWADIKVPAHIQFEGYDAPQYANTQYPWDGKEEIEPGEIPEHFNPTASYVKYFYVPESFKGHKVIINFQGVESGMALWCNGVFVGYSEDTFTPHEFDITDLVTDGENKLAVQVYKWTGGSWLEDQDFIRLSGIFRDVYLCTVPEVHVQDMKIQTLLNDTFDAADFVIHTTALAAGKVKVTLCDGKDVVLEKEETLDLTSEFHYDMKNPKLWSAEHPNLYDLTLTVMDQNGNVSEVITERVGFRRFEIKDSIMYINGKRIVFKGVNRHEFDSRQGRVPNLDNLKKDILTIKRNNMNAIRLCHYPNDSAIYRMCDEYGLYMIDETNLETHGSWDAIIRGLRPIEFAVPGNRPEYLDLVLDRANSMYQRDKNHPAIVIWSCGNEAFGGTDILEMSKFFHKVDPSRPVHYEGVNSDPRYRETSDMESRMYPPVTEIKEYLAVHRDKPYVLCEYTHAMGNSCGAMHKYTDLTDQDPLFQGGFIWDYVDQSIYKKDRYGKEFLSYGGDFDDRPTDYNFSGNGIVFGGERNATPKMQEVKFNYQGIAVTVDTDKNQVELWNKNLFTNSNEYQCLVTIKRDGEDIKTVKMDTDVEPLSKKTYDIPVAKETLPGEYIIQVSFVLKEDTIWAERGHEVAFGQGVYEVAGVAEDFTIGDASLQRNFKVIHGFCNIGVEGSNFKVIFSTLHGGLASYVYEGREMIKAMPKPNFWRTPTDNDLGNLMPYRYATWKSASMYMTHKPQNGYDKQNPTLVETKDSVTVTYTYFVPTTPASTIELGYTVYPDGRITTTLNYEPPKGVIDMPEYGVMFKFDADYENLTWYGNGPEDTYYDRQHGGKLGIYNTKVADNLTPYLMPQESGNKTEVRWAKVTDNKGHGMMFRGKDLYFNALPYTPHEVENAMHGYELPPIHYTVVRVALEQMGVGGDDSWGSETHPEYLLDVSKKLSFTFDFKGI